MNASSIHKYIAAIEAENKKLKSTISDKNMIIHRLDAEILKLHEKLDNVSISDDESSVYSSDEPEYEFTTPVSPPRYDDSERNAYFQSLNGDIYDALIEVSEMEEDEFKSEAYRNAAESIFNLPFKIVSGMDISSGPKKVPGVGKGIGRMIDRFLSTGKMMNTNEAMAEAFDNLANLTWNDNEYKARTFRHVANVLRNYDGTITSGKALSEGPQKIKGIGKHTAEMIDEFLTTGKIERLGN